MRSSDVWKKYWLSKDVENNRLTDRLGTYQIPLYLFLEKIVKNNNIKYILSAGSGQDIISLNLQKKFENKLQVTILDTSDEVLKWNKKLFERYKLNAEFIKADIFNMPLRANYFELVFNSGVMEHYEKYEQIKITKEILNVLKPSGFYISANPSDKGWLYKRGIEAAIKNKTWPYGDERPVKSLKFLKNEVTDVESVEEFDKDFFSQLGFLNYINPLWKLITVPVYFLTRVLYKFQFILQLFDFLLSKIFGTYLLISVIKKDKI